MKTFISIIVALLGTIQVFGVVYDSSESVRIDKIYYQFHSDNTATVTNVRYFTEEDRSEMSAVYSGTVIIPEMVEYEGVSYTVTAIGNYAFSNCKLKSLTIPHTVRQFYASSFYFMSTDELHISSWKWYCGIGLFYDTYRANSLLHTAKACYVGGKEVSFERLDFSSDDFAGVNRISLPHAFSGLQIEELIVPHTIECLSPCAFAYCSIGTARLDCKLIGDSTFYDVSQLNALHLGDNVSIIGEYAFYNYSSYLRHQPVSYDIYWGAGIKQVGKNAFDSYGIRQVYITDLASWCNVDFKDYKTNPVLYRGKLYLNGESITGDVVLPSNVTRIAKGAFYMNTDITSVTIPETTTVIEDYAFNGCKKLSKVCCEGVDSIGNYAFHDCEALAAIPQSGLRYIGESAFVNTSVVEAALDDIEHIGSYAFYNCNSLASVTLGSHLKYMGEAVFNVASLSGTGESPLMKVVSKSLTPCSLDPSTFTANTYRDGTLYVPVEAKERYMRFDGWRNFMNIVALPSEGTTCYLTLQDASNGVIRMETSLGSVYTFAFQGNDGWKVGQVTLNDTDVTDRMDKDGRITISIEDVETILNIAYEKDTSEKLDKQRTADNIRISAADNGIVVSNVQEATLCRINRSDGTLLLEKMLLRGTNHIALRSGGVYIINIGSTRKKIFLGHAK